MAFINGKWLPREERAERIQLVSDRAKKLVQLVKLGKATDYHLEQLREDKEELKKLKRVHRAERDFAFFLYEYLSDERNPDFDDNIIRHDLKGGRLHDPLEKMAPIHREFCDLCELVAWKQPDIKLAVAAARGHSKSGFFSNALPLFLLCFRLRRYLLICSETDTLAKKMISYVSETLKRNEKMREDFGPLMSPKQQENERDNEESFITSIGQLVESTSSGKRNRGRRHGSLRPDFFCGDDLSSEANEGTKAAREKLIHWWNTEIMPIGATGATYCLIGTMVSSKGLLNHCLERKDFKSSFHSAVVSPPTYPHLWDEYNEIYLKSDEMDEADAFYEKNKSLLEEGVQTAWSWRWTYRQLMHELANMGKRAFSSEYLNVALPADSLVFDIDKFDYYRYSFDNGRESILHNGQRIHIHDLYISSSWDIAMGKNSRSDYNSYITVGKHKQTGLIYVLDEYSSKEPPHKFMEHILVRLRKYPKQKCTVETINAYHEFFRQLQQRCAIEGLYGVQIVDIKSHRARKEERIEMLEPLATNKVIVFNANHRLLLDQMSQFPGGENDDCPDALSTAIDNISKQRARIVTKPAWL